MIFLPFSEHSSDATLHHQFVECAGSGVDLILETTLWKELTLANEVVVPRCSKKIDVPHFHLSGEWF